MEEPGCGTCRFGFEEPRGAVFARDRGAGWGVCRRHAPSVIVVPSLEHEALSQAAFPRVSENDWCGEYQSRKTRLAGFLGPD
jgi:hypothetical protein